jgi:class 3 adenylate cyclase/tetratricopeptide (TPR) repeat protein
VTNVFNWLQRLGLEKYASVFAANDVDSEALPLLEESDLEKLGVSLGHRRRMLHALAHPGDVPAVGAPQRQPSLLAGGAMLGGLPADTAAEAGERRHLTVLFCDMVGFTQLASSIDPELLQAIIQQYEDVCTACVEAYDGYVFQRLGDGIVAFFGYPVAHEDEAERGIRAGLDILAALARIDFPEAGHVQVRIGIACGLVVVQSPEKGAIGDTAVIASRLQSIAEPDTILVSGRVQKLTGDRFEYRDMGAQALKGIFQPVPTWQVLALRSTGNRFDTRRIAPLTPFVGRKAQVGKLRASWRAATSGQGQVVCIGGEAGIGKSRLARLIVDETRAEPGSWVIEAQCSPFHTQSGLYPFVNSLGRLIFNSQPDALAGASSGDDDAARRGTLEAFLKQSGLPVAEALPLISNLFSIPPAPGQQFPYVTAARARLMTRHFIIQLLVEAAHAGPGILLVEDLHWADPSALELIAFLVERVRDRRILLILTYRPDFVGIPETHDHISTLSLSRLRGTAVSELVRLAFAGQKFSDEVLQQVADKTDGVPLYIEEFARAVVESRLANATAVHKVAIPDTLQDSLMGRLDLLGEAKSIAQLAAILGREFGHDLLTAIWPGNAEPLEAGLDRLGRAGLIYPVSDGNQRRFAFKHALIQEAAYESLLRSHRVTEHARIAAIIETHFPAMVIAHPQVIAHHYASGRDPAKAALFWLAAGQQSLLRNAHVEAIVHLQNALRSLHSAVDMPDQQLVELDIQINLGTALVVAKGYASADLGVAWTRAHELCAHVGSVDRQMRALFGLWSFYSVGADNTAGLALSETLLDLAGTTGNEDAFIIGHLTMAMSRFFLGEFRLAQQSCEALLRVYDADRHGGHRFQFGQDSAAIANILLSWLYWLQGDAVAAAEAERRAFGIARRLAHPFTLSYVLAYAGWKRQYTGDVAGAEAIAAELIPLCIEEKIPLFHSNGVMLVGWALCQQGDADGPAELARGLAMYLATGSRVFIPYRDGVVAEAMSMRGEHEAALALFDKAHAVMNATRERWAEPELHRLRGVALDRANADPAMVEACFRAAIASARSLDAPTWQQAARASLASLLHRQGRSGEAAATQPVAGQDFRAFPAAGTPPAQRQPSAS